MAKGGFTGAVPPRETSPEDYSGVWDIVEQYGEQKAGNWPFQPADCAPKSLRFDGSSSPSDSLSRTPPIESDRRTWSWSAWIKRGKVSSEACIFTAGANTANTIRFNSNDTLKVNAGSDGSVETAAVFRDPSAWFHLLVTLQTGAVTDSDRLKIYVNNVLQTVSGTYPTKDSQGSYNAASVHYVGRQVHNEGNRFDGCIADLQFIDGQALTPDAFTFIDGQGIIQPKRFTGDYSSGPVYSNFITASNGGFHAAPYHQTAGFNNVIGTGSAGYVQAASGSNPNNLTFTPSSGIPYTNSVEVYIINAANTVTVNGGSAQTISAHQWVTVASGSGVLTSLKFERPSTSGASFSGIKIDGQLLQDASVGRNSFHLDFSDETKDQSGLGNDWTANNISSPKGYIAGISINAPSNVTLQSAEHHKMFNGSKDDYCYAHTNDATNFIQWTPTGGYPTDGHIWIQGGDGNGGGADGMTVEINGAAVSRSAVVDNEIYSSGSYGWGDWHKYAVAGNTLNSLKLIGAYALIRQLSTVADPTHSALGISDDNDVPAIVDTFPSTQDYLIDSPVNGNQTDPSGLGGIVQGNYCTLNPLKNQSQILSDGNLVSNGTSGRSTGTIYASSGKFYWEFTAGTSYTMAGIESSTSPQAASYSGENDQQYALYGNAGSGLLYHNGAATSFDGFVSGDVIGVALDMDGGNLYFYKNGVAMNSGTAAVTGLTGAWTANCRSGSGGFNGDTIFNFGQRAFAYTAPSGYKALNTANLPTPTIADGSTAFDVALWSGTGSNQTISLGFDPDLIWSKTRNHAVDHKLVDSVRGFTKQVEPNQAIAEYTNSTGVTGTSSSGFTIGSSNDWNNPSSRTYVGWAWSAGDATTTIAAGSLNSSVYNLSSTWSNLVSTTDTLRSGGGAFAYGALSTIFDGNLANGVGTDSGNLTLSFSSGISTSNSTVEVYIYHTYSATITAGGNTYTTNTGASGTTEWVKVSGVSGTITQITVNGSGSVGTCGGIKIDGKILADSGASVANVPSIASTVRSSPESGFSIVTWTAAANATVAHQLNKSPQLVITKSRQYGTAWRIWSSFFSSPDNRYLGFDTNGEGTYNGYWGSMTSNVITMPSVLDNNYGDMVAYCFTSIEGYSSFGSFQNPSSTEGAFVFLGFEPELLMIKCIINISSSSSSGDWIIKDATRSPFNNPSDGNTLVANVANAEDGYYSGGQAAIDFLSNGFKIRHPNSSPAGDTGRLYIYAAWAKSPFKNARAR